MIAKRTGLGVLTVAAILTLSCAAPVVPDSPENVALLAARAIARGDFRAYQRLTLNPVDVLKAETGSPGGRGSFADEVLEPEQRARIRGEFETAVAAKRLTSDGARRCAAEAKSLARDFWIVTLAENDTPLGFEMGVRRWNNELRITSLRVLPR